MLIEFGEETPFMDDTELNLINDVDIAEMWKHLEFLCDIDRTSGTEGEYKSVRYIAEILKSYGIDVKINEFMAYLSYPKWAQIQTVDGRIIEAKTRAFSEATPEEGVEGEIVYVPGGSDMFTDTETVERIKSSNLAGKIVLSEGGGRQNMIMARRMGAVGYIHLWPSDEDVIHEGIVTPIWGTPTPDNIDTCPEIPVVAVKRKDGLMLKDMASKAPTKIRLFTKVETGWRKLLLPEVIIPGKTDDFVLVGGHLDSWHLGATDNATGNVTCLELARVLKIHQDELIRGVRICWWPGHSTGRYAGSTWYCDHNWQDLRDHCVTYINIDSPGPLGATDYSEVTMVAENDDMISSVVHEVTGQVPQPERPVRAGDQSFWGPGITSAYMLLSNRPKELRASVGGSGYGWWWHTEEDTIDKVEKAVLDKDCKIYALTAYRLCTSRLLPLKVSSLARELLDEVSKLEKAANGLFDLGQTVLAAKKLDDAASKFDLAASRIAQSCPCNCVLTTANSAMLEAIKNLTPIRYSPEAPYEHGPAIPIEPIPMLQPVKKLAKLNPDSDEFGFLRNWLVRRQNWVVRSMLVAARALESALEEIE